MKSPIKIISFAFFSIATSITLSQIPISPPETLIRDVDMRLFLTTLKPGQYPRMYVEYLCFAKVPLILRRDDTIVYVSQEEHDKCCANDRMKLRHEWKTRRVSLTIQKRNVFGGIIMKSLDKIEVIPMTNDVYPLK